MASRNMKMADAVQQLKAHWNDLANRCVRDNRPYFTDFLPAEDTAMAEAIANTAGAVCTAWGGTENTTRVIFHSGYTGTVPDPVSDVFLSCS